VTERDAFGNPIDPGQPQAPAIAPLGDAQAPPPPPLSPTQARDLETQAWIAFGCGIGGIFLVPILLSIAAIMLARRPRRELPLSAPRSAATAGHWIAVATLVLWVLGLVFLVLLIVAFGASG